MAINFDFSQKVALVTGSSKGIGAGIAKKLAEAGAHVVVTYSSSSKSAEELVATLKSGDHMCLHLNVADENSVNSVFAKVVEKYGRLDFLVNNAGITKDQLLLRMKPEDFDSVIATNLRGVFLCTREAIKLMIRARNGSIVNITSVVGLTGNAGQSNYAASKAGVEGFTKSIAQEVASRSVRVNCVAPGFIVTEMTNSLSDKQKEMIQEKIPLNSLGEVEDIANATCFLLSHDAKYITGHTLSVNGGMHM